MDGANFATCVVFELAWWTGGQGGRARARGGCKGFGSGGVGGSNVCRIFVVSNAYKKKKNGVF